MKHSKFIIGFICGFGLLFLISATTSTNDDGSRYHIVWPAYSTGYIYDSKTGEYVEVSGTKFRKGHNLQDFLTSEK